MSEEQIRSALLQVLKEVIELGGNTWEGLSPAKKPLGDLGGFDSLCSIEATVLIEQKLGCSALCAGSLFISEDGTEALTIDQVVTRIQQLVKKQNTKEKR